jgi:hypothetical protein
MTSYLSELKGGGGVVAGLAVLGTLFCSGNMNIRSIRVIFDNKIAVNAVRRPPSESIFHNTRYDWDLIAMIQDLIARWCKGNADLIDSTLTRDERLIIEADIQADVIRSQAC